ncbi:MAG: sugar kinase [Candidatus Gastranaerophilales bacterium]|nr:sugar kinase [Candidatus Gastranaerophilales bacterium]
MNEKLDIITIGESLIELSTNEDLTNAKSLDKYYGGDTLTTAIAALRMGSKVGFISRIGMDCFKNYLLESWQEEGLDISQVKPVQGINGLYILSEAKDFSFYRKKTAATNLSVEDISADYIKNSSLLYTTGVTQSISLSAREAVKEAFKIAKENNVITAYDPNYTSKIWTGDEAKEAFDEIIEYSDIVFLNVKYDSKIVIDSNSIDKTIKYLWDKGVTTVIIKSPGDKCYYAGNNGKIELIRYINENSLDYTGFFDTFNGGFLHGITSGMSVFKAVTLGAVEAGIQSKNIGAIKSIPYKEEVYKVFKGQND